MPGPLRDVEQKFSSDWTEYIGGFRKGIEINREMVTSVQEVQREIAKLGDVLKGLPDSKKIRIDVDTGDAMGKLAALKGELGALGDKEITVAVKYATTGDKPGEPGGVPGLGGDGGAMLRELRDISASMDQATSSMGRMEDHMVSIRRSVENTASGLAAQTQTLRDNADAHDAAAEATTRFVRATRDATGTVGRGSRSGYNLTENLTPFGDLYGGSIFAGRGGGGGGGWGAAALAAAAGGGGGGPAPGTAAAQFATVAAFTKRWYPAAHWAMMLTNEVLATVGPAAAAGGMGALVGVQGAEQAIPRLQAVFNTGESLGGSLGMTQGQYMGLKTPQLQNAQDLATGAAFSGIGALTNIMRAGGGSPFIQLGSNTVAMWTRMMANITTEFQKGLGKQLGGLVAGGTDYLAQFGHVFGNLGHTFLNVAPNLPGVGGDLLSILQGATGGLSAATGWLGPALGPILGFEGGARWGPPIVGGLGKLLATAGKPLIAGGTALSGAAVDAGLATRLGAAGFGAGGILEGAGTGLATAGAALGTLTAPEIGILGGTAFMIGKGLTYQTPGQQYAGGLVSQVNQAGIAQSMPMAIAAMQKLSGVKPPDYPTSGLGGAFYQDLNNIFTTGRGLAKGHPGALVTGVEAGVKGFWDETFGGKTLPSNAQAASTAINQLSQGLVNAFGAGQQVSDQWQKLSGASIGMGKAFDVATMAQLQLGKSFEQSGKLTPQAKQMIANLYAGYQPMNMNTGQFGAAVGAQTAMSGLQHTQVAAVNTAYDQLTQLVASGPSGAAALSGLIGAMPAGSGAAMKGFLSPKASAAWTAFASTTSPSVISQLQSQTDYLREAQTMGALGAGQSKSMTEFLLGQALPSAKGSPSALAMLSMIGQQAGGPAFAPGTSAAQMYKQLHAFAAQGGGAGGFTAGMTQSTEKMANIGRDAQQFVQQIGSGIGGALAQGIATHGASLQDAFMSSVTGKGFSLPALEKYGKFLAGSGVPQAGAVDMAKYAAQLAGAGPGMQKMISSQLGSIYAKLKLQVDTAGAKAAIANLAHVAAQPHVTVKALTAAAQAAINAIKGKDVPVTVREQGVEAVRNAIDSIHGKNVTVTITTINRMITQAVGAGVIGAPGGVLSATLAGGPANMRIRAGAQTGKLIPGYGGGDIYPAMLEPGELVVPKHLVGSVAPILSGKIPGFAAGGGMGVMGFETMLNAAFHGDSVQNSLKQILDSLIGTVIQAHSSALTSHPAMQALAGTGGTGAGKTSLPTIAQAATQAMQAYQAAAHTAGKGISVKVLEGLMDGIKNAGPAAKAAATALLNKMQQEMAYAKGTSANMLAGLNFGGMNVDPATGNGPVATQMQSYAASLKAFSADIKSMTKGGLNKDLLKQMIAAGPVQGDALAQSISSGPGGIKAVNQLYAQIQHLSKGIGAQAAGAVYGGTIAPNMKSGTIVTNNVSVNVSMGGGAAGDLNSLSPKQLKALVDQVQQALLKQAHRNRKTGVAVKGKGA